jgi:hypothetical protein
VFYSFLPLYICSQHIAFIPWDIPFYDYFWLTLLLKCRPGMVVLAFNPAFRRQGQED